MRHLQQQQKKSCHGLSSLLAVNPDSPTAASTRTAQSDFYLAISDSLVQQPAVFTSSAAHRSVLVKPHMSPVRIASPVGTPKRDSSHQTVRRESCYDLDSARASEDGASVQSVLELEETEYPVPASVAALVGKFETESSSPMHARLPPAPCNSPFNAKAASRSPCKVMAGKLAAAVATIDKSSAPACAHLQAGMDWNYEMQRSPAAPCLETDLDQAVGRHAGQSRGEAGDSQAPAGSTPFASYRPGCGAAADPAGIAWPSQELSAADEASHWERLVSDAAALHRETLRLAQDAQPLQSMRSLRRIRTVSDEATDDGPGLKSVGSLSLSTALSRQMSARISALRAEQPGGMVGLDAAHNEPRLHSRLSSGAASLPDAMSILEAEALSPLTRVQDVPPSRQAPSPQLGDSSSLLRGLMKDLQTLRSALSPTRPQPAPCSEASAVMPASTSAALPLQSSPAVTLDLPSTAHPASSTAAAAAADLPTPSQHGPTAPLLSAAATSADPAETQGGQVTTLPPRACSQPNSKQSAEPPLSLITLAAFALLSLLDLAVEWLAGAAAQRRLPRSRRGGAMPAGDESRHETETLLSGSRLEEVVTSLYCLAGSVAGVLAWIQA